MNATPIQVQPFQPSQYAWGAPAPAATAVAYRPPSAPPTVAKVRWGRIVLGLAAASMLGFGLWTTFGGHADQAATLTPAASRSALTPLATGASSATTVAAGGIHKQGKPGAGLPDAATPIPEPVVDSSSDTSAPSKITTAPTSAPVDTAPTTAPMKDTTPPSTESAPVAAAAPSDPVIGGGGAPDAAPTITDPTTAPAVAPRTAVRGGGATELPYTGAETWIVAILGIMILLVGILIQINAVRIGMTAMLYRRGILLRPVDCARLANERGFAPVRVWISNVLHYLLTEPANADFVTAR
jgi:hypothetical protein